MIDVGDAGGSENPKLHISRREIGQYAALSYCWGGPQPVVLTQSSLESMRQEIPMSRLPETIQDAIISTRKLGLRYIWIDALCIIQDFAADKELEISKMDHLYQNTYVTICAASAVQCSEGFLREQSLPHKSSKLSFPCPDGLTGNTHLQSDLVYPAWTEHLLSPRALTYGSWQLYWQCQSIKYFNGVATSTADGRGIERLAYDVFTEAGGPFSSSTVTEQFWYDWSGIVQEYSGRGLTEQADKLPALSGITEKFHPAMGDV